MQGDSCFKPELTLLFQHFSSSPFSIRLHSSPATILSVHLISWEAGNQITLNYKVIKGHLKSCLSKHTPAPRHGGASARKIKNSGVV